jgi:hypothetical protein
MRFRILKTELKSEANSTSIAPDNVFTTAAPLLLLRNPSTTFCPNCTRGLTLLTSSKATEDSTAAMAPSNHNIVLAWLRSLPIPEINQSFFCHSEAGILAGAIQSFFPHLVCITIIYLLEHGIISEIGS